MIVIVILCDCRFHFPSYTLLSAVERMDRLLSDGNQPCFYGWFVIFGFEEHSGHMYLTSSLFIFMTSFLPLKCKASNFFIKLHVFNVVFYIFSLEGWKTTTTIKTHGHKRGWCPTVCLISEPLQFLFHFQYLCSSCQHFIGINLHDSLNLNCFNVISLSLV